MIKQRLYWYITSHLLLITVINQHSNMFLLLAVNAFLLCYLIWPRMASHTSIPSIPSHLLCVFQPKAPASCSPAVGSSNLPVWPMWVCMCVRKSHIAPLFTMDYVMAKAYKWPYVRKCTDGPTTIITIVSFLGATHSLFIQVDLCKNLKWANRHISPLFLWGASCLLARGENMTTSSHMSTGLEKASRSKGGWDVVLLSVHLHYKWAQSSMPLNPLHTHPSFSFSLALHSHQRCVAVVELEFVRVCGVCHTSSKTQRQIHVLKCGPRDGPHYACLLHQQGPRLELAHSPLSPNRWK